MEITELRIGNIIFCGDGQEYEVVKWIIPETMNDEQEGSAAIVTNYHCDNQRYFEAIPLTDKWLKKFGFKKHDGAWYKLDSYYIDIELFKYKGKRMNHYGIGIGDWLDVRLGKLRELKYVHQLQNFWHGATGEDLSVGGAENQKD